MSGNQRLHLRKVVESRTEASRHLRSPGDAVLVDRGVPRWLLISCPCGCGEELPINLDSRAGKAWRLYRNPKWGLSLFPSVWRDTDCRSHFIIWRGQILLFGRNEDEFDESSFGEESMPTAEAVLTHIPTTGMISFSDIAEALDAVPWDVLRVCRKLVRSGNAYEGRGKERGSFRRKSQRQ